MTLQIDFQDSSLKSYFYDFASILAWTCIDFINTFINLVKRSLVRRETRSEIGASRKVGALKRIRALLPFTLDFFTKLGILTSSFYSSVKLARR